MARDMLRELYEEFRHRRHDRYERSRLSPSEQLRLVELILEVEREPEMAGEILESLPDYIKYGNGYFTSKIKRLEQRI